MRIHAMVEIAGFPKEHVEETIKKVIEKLKAEPDMEILEAEIAEAKENKEMWSTFAELELRINEIDKLIYFCLNYMPSTLEIIRPEQFEMDALQMTGLFNELLAKLHQYETVTKHLYAENIVLKRKLEKKN